MRLCQIGALRFIDRSRLVCKSGVGVMPVKAVRPAMGGHSRLCAFAGRSGRCNNSVMVKSHATSDIRRKTGYFFRSKIVKYHQIGKKVHGCKETNIGGLQSELKAPPSRFLRLALSCENCVFPVDCELDTL